MSKTALIVDDSKSARLVLKRMLETYDLQVDTSESAEAALEYLESRRPDVIFMDHMMPGMDGFEAVTAIKKNPATAMIPIMMYTSQEGEVYVGQARALGAVGVLPKTVEPVEVSKILASLHLTEPAPATETEQDAVSKSIDAAGIDGNLRDLLQDLFDQQRVILQRELYDTYSNFTQKFASELRQAKEEEAEAEGPPQPPTDTAGGHWPVILLLVVVVLSGLLFFQQRQFGLLEEENARLSAFAESTPQQADEMLRRLDGYQNAINENRAMLVDALEWGTNQQEAYHWDEVPLNDRRVRILNELLSRLIAIGYVGEVGVAVHVGNFCLVDDGLGQWTLAPPTLDVTACELLGFDTTEALGMASRQSVAFANFVVTAEEQSGGAIQFVIDPRGNTEPRVAYPEAFTGLVASEWNDIAALNNRVTVSLRAELL